MLQNRYWMEMPCTQSHHATRTVMGQCSSTLRTRYCRLPKDFTQQFRTKLSSIGTRGSNEGWIASRPSAPGSSALEESSNPWTRIHLWTLQLLLSQTGVKPKVNISICCYLGFQTASQEQAQVKCQWSAIPMLLLVSLNRLLALSLTSLPLVVPGVLLLFLTDFL